MLMMEIGTEKYRFEMTSHTMMDGMIRPTTIDGMTMMMATSLVVVDGVLLLVRLWDRNS
jgi:hypothetical protein